MISADTARLDRFAAFAHMYVCFFDISSVSLDPAHLVRVLQALGWSDTGRFIKSNSYELDGWLMFWRDSHCGWPSPR